MGIIKKEPKGVKYDVSGDTISEIISSFFEYSIESPKYDLFYHPYWFFEIHTGLEKHTGVLDATTTEIIINPRALENVKQHVATPLEELNLGKKIGFDKNNLRYAKINDFEEAEKIILYKTKFLYPDKNALVTQPHLINVPIWDVTVKGKNIHIYGNDKDYKTTIHNKLKTLFPQRKPTESEVFVDTLKGLKNPKNILSDFKWVIKNTNKTYLILFCILILIIIYFIVKMIIFKVG